MSLNTLASNLIGKVFDNTLPGGATVSSDAVYKVRGNPTYDPSTGTRSPSETQVSIKVISKSKSYYTHEGIGKETMSFVAEPFEGLDITNVSKDILTIDSQDYRVISVDRVQMGSTNLIFKIRVGEMTVDSRRTV